MSVTTATTTIANKVPRSDAGPANLTIQPVRDEAARRDWAAYVENSPQGTLFHHPDWCETVCEVFGHHSLNCIARRDDRVVGLLPLVEVRSLLAGKMLVSVPYAPYGGIIADDDTVRAELAGEARRLTDKRNARSLHVRGVEPVFDDLPVNERYAVFVRRLPLRVEELETYLPRKARAAVRQARKREGLTVQHDARLLDVVWQLYARSMRRLASLNYPWRFFETLARRLETRAWITGVWKEQQPVAGLLSFVFRDTVYPYFVGVDERLRCTGATNLIYFSVMERAVRAGLGWFDFGRSRRDNTGSFDFKRNQGFEPRTLAYQHYIPAGRTAPDLTPSNPRFSLARRVWPRLPLAITQPLGSWLSHSIPG